LRYPLRVMPKTVRKRNAGIIGRRDDFGLRPGVEVSIRPPGDATDPPPP
jgi:hypothetical protein